MPSEWPRPPRRAATREYLRGMNRRIIIRSAAAIGIAAVALGAFGAHGLRRLVSPTQIETFEIGIRYAFYHALALGVLGALYGTPEVRTDRLHLAAWLWLGGVVLFSGSLALLTLRDRMSLPVAILGPLTPIGGLLLIAGWASLLFCFTKSAR